MKGRNKEQSVTIDGRTVAIEGERNLLELIRKAGVELPTFCYHSELSAYGACRLCLVEIEGGGIQGACSLPPEPGMRVQTNTRELRDIRKISVELLLANHDRDCTSCIRSGSCQLQDIARRLGVTSIRYPSVLERREVDCSNPALVRDPNKCVLCGDCVRFCDEIQGVGVIDFAWRGHETRVLPAWGRNMGEVDCIHCGQCAVVCPTGALTPATEIDAVWKAIDDPDTVVVAQLAPAVRVALGEHFGVEYRMHVSGQIVAALKRMGFDLVYDTSFAADLLVIEEAQQFLARKTTGERLPLFASTCPGWVKFAEQFYPQLLGHLSSCRSPQQMMGALVKHALPNELGKKRKQVVMVAITSCTAAKFEARRPEFRGDGQADVDHVLTTLELATMIEQSGLSLAKLHPASFDMPMGFKSGAGVLSGTSGGASEALLRYLVGKVTGENPVDPEFTAIRGQEPRRRVNVEMGGLEVKVVAVHGLRQARDVIEAINSGQLDADYIEVMACPDGCVGGGGQPLGPDRQGVRERRAQRLYRTDRVLDLHCPQENHFVEECYRKFLDEPGSRDAQRLLHTRYHQRRNRTGTAGSAGQQAKQPSGPLSVKVCAGTGCFLRNSQGILQGLMKHVEANDLDGKVSIQASHCFERCGEGPNVAVGEVVISQATLEKVVQAVHHALSGEPLLDTEKGGGQ